MTILQRSCTVMMKKSLTSVAFAAGCAIALAIPAARAQTLDMQRSMYEHLMDRNEADLQSRMQRECGSFINAHLRTGCMDSLAIEEDQRSRGLRDGLTGDSD